MKYIKLFEKFTKEYQSKIDLKDFKKIKKGSMIQYMGGAVEVVDNNGYVLKLKDDDGKTFTVNKSQFDHGGRISEVSDGKKKKKKKEFHPDMMYEAKGKKVVSDLYKMDAQIDYLSDADDDTKKIWKKAGVNPNDDNQIILYSYVNSWPETKKLLDKSRIKYKELEDPNSAGESFIVFNVDESVNELRSTPVSGTMAGSTQSLEDRKYELKKDAKGATIGNFSNVTLPKGTIIYNLPGGVFADHFSLKNKYASRSSRGPQYFDKPTFKGIMIKQTPAVLSYIEKNSKVLESVVTESKGYKAGDEVELKTGETVKINQVVKGPRAELNTYRAKVKGKQIDFSLSDINESIDEAAKPYKKGQRVDYQLTHKGGVGKFADATSKSKNIESGVIKKRTKGFAGTFKYELTNGLELYGSEIVGLTEASSTDGGNKSNGNSHHDDHTDNTIAQHWKDIYGEEFHSKYPAVAKIIKQRNIKDKRELSRIWDETYGENFEEQYPALFNKLD